MLTHEQDISYRWKEHFEEVLNVRSNTEIDMSIFTHDITAVQKTDLGEISEAEVMAAIKEQKTGKACGTDIIAEELLKADVKNFG